MKEQFAKDVMKLAIKHKVLKNDDQFISESLEKLAVDYKIPVKLSGISASVFQLIFNVGNTKTEESYNG